MNDGFRELASLDISQICWYCGYLQELVLIQMRKPGFGNSLSSYNQVDFVSLKLNGPDFS